MSNNYFIERNTSILWSCFLVLVLSSFFYTNGVAAPACGSYSAYSYSSNGVEATMKASGPYGRSCTDYDSVDYANWYVQCTGSGNEFELYVKSYPNGIDSCDLDEFNCDYDGCNSYDQMWTGNNERDIRVKSTSGDIADHFWVCLARDSSYAVWQGLCDYTGDEVNKLPDKPFNPVPSDGSTGIEVSPQLEVDVSDQEGDPIDVEFYDASTNNRIYTDFNVPDGGTASTTWYNADGYDSTYSWYVKVDDDNDLSETSNTWSFTTEDYPPNTPTNLQPNDGTIVPVFNQQISAKYKDQGGEDGTLHFKDSGDSLIGSCDVSSDNRCGVNYALDHGENYWYVVAEDDTGDKSGQTSTFELIQNNPPSNIVSPDNPSNGVTIYDDSVYLDVTVSDPNSDNMDVEFLNNQSNLSTSERTDSNVASGGTASIDMENLVRGKTYKWWVKVSDNWESTSSGSWEFYVNELPTIYNINPEDGGAATDEEVYLDIKLDDAESDSLNIFYYKGNNVLIDSLRSISSGSASVKYPDTEIGNEYQWFVNVSDGYENYTSNIFSFDKTTYAGYRAEPRIDYRYSAVLIEQGSSKNVFFNIENNINESKVLKTYLSGVNASFATNGQNSISYTLDNYSDRRFIVHIDPESLGSKSLDVITENQEFGVNTSTSIPVTVKSYTEVSETSEVPGIGTIQIVLLLLISSTIYMARL